jgi:hypothetical protein
MIATYDVLYEPESQEGKTKEKEIAIPDKPSAEAETSWRR